MPKNIPKAIAPRVERLALRVIDRLYKDPSFQTMDLPDLGDLVLMLTNDEIELNNKTQPQNQRLPRMSKLTPYAIGEVLLRRFSIANIANNDSDSADEVLTCVYQTSGPRQGLYVEACHNLKHEINLLSRSTSPKEKESVFEYLGEEAPLKLVSSDPDLIAVNNGIFNYKTKTLQPFSPDLVFLSKSRVNYVPNPSNPVIHNDEDGTDWDVETWFQSLSDDPEVVDLLWKIAGAVIRPHVRWNKSPWLYSEKGNNGKGTFCAMLRNLCGRTANIALDQFEEPFMLASLVGASAIITDENTTNAFIPKAAAFKAIITHDPFILNRKFEQPVKYCFNGLVVQCINGLPKTSDKSNSLYRRILLVPMIKCFTGKERKYIKNDYLNRSEVLEYVLHKILHTNYYELPDTQASSILLKEYRSYNDPVRDFMDEILPQCKWDLLPFTFLYDIYKVWFKENNESGSIQGRNTFINTLINDLDETDAFECLDKNVRYNAKSRMKADEPLVRRYNTTSMMPDPTLYSGSGPKAYKPVLDDNTKFRGLLRKK